MNYEDKRLHVINTFITTRHICVTQQFVSRARHHICVAFLITYIIMCTSWLPVINCCNYCCWLSIYVFYMYTSEYVRYIT